MVNLEKIKQIVQQAGNLVLSHFRLDMKVYQKEGGSIVTEVDLACEQFLKKELSVLIPGSGFLAEESGVLQGNEYTWVIDPIDGTRNFERGLPYFCISVALMHQEQVVAAVTYAPALQDIFYAQHGYGAWHNDKKLSLQDKKWEEVAILAVVSGEAMRKENDLNVIRSSCQSLTKTVGFRVNGAAALDLAYVAAGMFDVVLFDNLQWWDAAAGVLLVGEAGGSVSQSDGVQIDQKSKSFIAGNRDICKALLSHLIR